MPVSLAFDETESLDKICRDGQYRQIEGDDMSFDGQRVVIVGGSAGIGEAAARAFAAAGAQVTITGRSKQRLDAAAGRIGYLVEVRELDATGEAAVEEFFGSAQPFDHLVLAASPGAVGSGPFTDLDTGALKQAFDGKFFAYVTVLKAARPSLRDDGSVTIVSAVSARAAYPGAAGLAAVNGALEAMVPTLAVELAPLRVNAVSPGVIDTPWWHGLPEDQRAAFFNAVAAASPVRRVGTPEDVAQAIVYLAGAGFVTGTVLECTGGANLTVGAIAG
jgi:NAD(P)-dependent dehydrogenase (short-subunit alcohol dehydrogenase family)